MFQTDDSWEQLDEREIFRSLFNQPGLRRHPLVEVATNTTLFHVDVVFGGEAEELGFWARFIGTDLKTVVEFLTGNDVVRSKVSMQTAHVETEVYRSYPIDKIYKCQGRDGEISFQCQFADGKSALRSSHEPQEDIVYKKIEVWSRSGDGE